MHGLFSILHTHTQYALTYQRKKKGSETWALYPSRRRNGKFYFSSWFLILNVFHRTSFYILLLPIDLVGHILFVMIQIYLKREIFLLSY